MRAARGSAPPRRLRSCRNHTSSLSRAVDAAGADGCTFCKPREKALALLADRGNADRPLFARERAVSDHIKRAEERFQRRHLVALQPGVELLGRHIEEARQAVPATKGLLGAAQRCGIARALIHVGVFLHTPCPASPPGGRALRSAQAVGRSVRRRLGTPAASCAARRSCSARMSSIARSNAARGGPERAASQSSSSACGTPRKAASFARPPCR